MEIVTGPKSMTVVTLSRNMDKKPVAISELPKADWPPSGRYVGYFNLGGERCARVEEKAVHVAWSQDGQVEAIGDNSICGVFGVRGHFDHKIANGRAKPICEMEGKKWYLGGIAERPALGATA